MGLLCCCRWVGIGPVVGVVIPSLVPLMFSHIGHALDENMDTVSYMKGEVLMACIKYVVFSDAARVLS